ncbi:hypothetical protein DENSPDRAFT_855171 [Dentipellis sp. KUC8613]|nr:hypothetical protein DENSPDRAFT_855171 [Dentipellis sp. KUC8613]
MASDFSTAFAGERKGRLRSTASDAAMFEERLFLQPDPSERPLDIREEAWLEEVIDRFRRASSADKTKVVEEIQNEFRAEFPYPDEEDTYWKKVTKQYLYDNGRERNPKDFKRWTRNYGVRDVIAYFKKNEVDSEREKPAIDYYQDAVTKVENKLTHEEYEMFEVTAKAWREQGVPPKIQQAYAILVLSPGFDYMDEVGGRGFKKTLPNWREMKMHEAFDAYVKSFDEPPPPPKTKAGHMRVVVESDTNGRPVYATYDPKWDGDTKQDLVRDVMKHAYGSASKSNRGVPWTKLSEFPNDFIDQEYLASPTFRWKDPSHLTVDDVSALLAHWETRRQAGKPILEFKAVWHKKSIVPVAALPAMMQREAMERRQRAAATVAERRKLAKAKSSANDARVDTSQPEGHRREVDRPDTPRPESRAPERRPEDDETEDEDLGRRSPPNLRPRKVRRSTLGVPLSDDYGDYHADQFSGNGTEDEYVEPTQPRRKGKSPVVGIRGKSPQEYNPEIFGQLWGPGNERVVNRDEVFPISTPPPSPAECRDDCSARVDFIQKLYNDQTYKDITLALEHGEILPPRKVKFPSIHNKYKFISWDYDMPWLPLDFWLDTTSLQEMREWCERKPWIEEEKYIFPVGVWSAVRALGMIGREIWLKCLSDSLPDPPTPGELGDNYPFDTEQALTLDDTNEWATFVNIQLSIIWWDITQRVPPFASIPVRYTPGAPNKVVLNSLERARYLLHVYSSTKFMEVMTLWAALENDIWEEEIPRAEYHPEWASWDYGSPWTPRLFYSGDEDVENLVKWMSAHPWRSYGGTSVGGARVSQVLLVFAMLHRELFLYRSACDMFPNFTTWTGDNLGYHFPKHLKSRSLGNKFDVIEALLEDIYPKMVDDLTLQVTFLEEEQAAAQEIDPPAGSPLDFKRTRRILNGMNTGLPVEEV